MPNVRKTPGAPQRDPKNSERYGARGQSLLGQEERKYRKVRLGEVLAWIGMGIATASLAIPTGSFLSSVLSTFTWVCYLIAVVLHSGLAVSVDHALKNRWKPSTIGVIGFSIAITGLLTILAGIGYRRFDTYLTDGDTPFAAASSALLWFLLESVIPIICGIILAQASDEAKRRSDNCRYFEGLLELIESNPGHERETWDAMIADADREYKAAKRHYPGAKRLIAQLSYRLNLLKTYHPDQNKDGDDDGDGVDNNGDGTGGDDMGGSGGSNIYTSRAERGTVYNGR